MAETGKPGPQAAEPKSERSKIAHELHEGQGLEAAITVLRPVSHVFSFWRDFHNLPRFTRHLERVEATEPGRSKWTWRTTDGQTLEWETEIIAEIQDRMISWQTRPGSQVHQAGSVWFRPTVQDDATEVHVILRYGPPTEKTMQRLKSKVLAVFGEERAPSLLDDLRDSLRQMRSLLEAGETPTVQGQPRGSSGIFH